MYIKLCWAETREKRGRDYLDTVGSEKRLVFLLVEDRNKNLPVLTPYYTTVVALTRSKININETIEYALAALNKKSGEIS